ncbi:ATP synthase subunit I [Paenibacillus sp. IB182496]|uniref:ATP synthase subunit I n=1 Tax=Paenibacillus sabuli TaxID=2772509 RepID=A0A927GSC9_9BACL|nr:ATP synthase subunit I [Paenibacillus sabuli]MBD2845895.1 ATP synthase subunit I [Paenibacillus sabuli]
MRSTLWLATVCIVLWIFVPQGKPVAAGIVLGLVASIVNAFILRRRVEALGSVIHTGRRKPLGLGVGARIAMVLFVALIGLRYPDRFSLPAVLISSFYVQFAIYVTAFFNQFQNTDRKG